MTESTIPILVETTVAMASHFLVALRMNAVMEWLLPLNNVMMETLTIAMVVMLAVIVKVHAAL